MDVYIVLLLMAAFVACCGCVIACSYAPYSGSVLKGICSFLCGVGLYGVALYCVYCAFERVQPYVIKPYTIKPYTIKY